MFETFGVTGLFTSEQPILSLYGCGRLSGLCVDIGAEKIGARRRRRAHAALHSRSRCVLAACRGS